MGWGGGLRGLGFRALGVKVSEYSVQGLLGLDTGMQATAC